MSLKRLLVALLGVSLLYVGAARAELDENYSVILMTENFPPYNMATNDKNYAREENLKGIAVEVVREMFKRAGINYHMTLRFPWARIYKLALEKPNHGVFVAARLPEREKLFKWVGPIGPDDWVMLAKADSPITINSLEQAKQYRIGAYKGDAIAEHLLAQGLEPLTSFRDQENARKLQEGKIDLWATGDPAGRYLAKQEGVTGLKTVLRFETAELFLALNPETPDEVVQKLQQELDKMRQEGFVDKVLNSYL
ncbi:substrate-binding periplasmic protein [Aquipseudomonas guryensis]|jgi:polar amino acid transport system substrate-binding protein|uniref:ABC transporter substrate-binding protein n=1 Tax=Aquipseudomonas guryensis TaxID=2759165 RepID=A0A7W4H2V6_9GAMM|nr:ABC transporter substrate-binding protein [Pseudomonas guryensis]MBB1518963.1 ABC transporter substrate-binding protein [Pseudomonas guryensis]